jgi:hypothetical protein
VYGYVCPVVWEDGGREAPSYPITGVPRATAHIVASMLVVGAGVSP